MWITVYFKSGKTIETLISSFGELDKLYNKDDIMQIDMGCTMLNENKVRQQELLSLKIKLYKADQERLNGDGLSFDEVKKNLNEIIK